MVDRRGRPVAGVAIATPSGAITTTDSNGEFHLETDDSRVTATYGDLSTEQAIDDPDGPVVLTLAPRLADEVTVTATRSERRLGESAASVVTISREELELSPQLTLDDALRQVPGFALFRRSGSRIANPTAQGVSLRGVGASGASRAIVLDEGIPLNDPFGGWVYWGRIPLLDVERVEVMRGGASDLYGNAAMGGVVNIIRRREGPALEVEASFGSLETTDGSIAVRGESDDWRYGISANHFDTAGYVTVDRRVRGAVDRPATSEHNVIDLDLARDFSGGSVFVRLTGFDEERGNGTLLQVNETEARQVSVGADSLAAVGSLQLRLFASKQDYFQTFSAIAPGRAIETLTREQRVPSDSSGFSLLWSGGTGRLTFLSGVEGRRVDATNDETAITAGGISRTVTSARQDVAGAFVEALVPIGAKSVATAGIRFDRWENGDAVRRSSGGELRFEERSDRAWSPRLTLLHHANSHLSLTASAYRSFRAPTLNELYRPFRVGNVLTLANDRLSAETLTGVEAGASWELGPAAAVRLNLFRMEVDDPVANVTLAVTPSLITRQRQNLGRTATEGAEVESEWRAGRWSLAAGYLYSDAAVEANDEDPSLVGLRVPQVPLHQGTLRVGWRSARAGGALEGRCASRQFDDDRNELALASFCTADGRIDLTLGRGLGLFLSGENLTGANVETGRTPLLTLGPPRQWRAGVKYALR